MRQLYTLELIALIRELQEWTGFHIDKFYESREDTFRLSLSKGGVRAEMMCALPYSVNRTEYIERAEIPTNFAMAVRNRISGFVIEAIEQYSNDRIMLMRLSKGSESENLVFEMFGKGNLIVADKGMKIQLVYKPHVFKDRTVKTGATYVPPKNNNISALDASAITDELGRLIASNSDRNEAVLPYLSKRIGIGTIYIEDSLLRAGVDLKAKAAELTQAQLKEMTNAIVREVKACAESGGAMTYSSKEGIVDFSLCPMAKYSHLENQRFESMQEMLDQVYQKGYQQPSKRSAEVEGLKQSIEQQRASLDSIDKEAAYSKSAGDAVLNDMQRINLIIEALRKDKHMTKEGLQKLAEGIRILDINLKDKIVTIEC
jgi:predicted ribosome quality control (RQC) complex YloA/Tae2 family protein